jgi:hypothetical protein
MARKGAGGRVERRRLRHPKEAGVCELFIAQALVEHGLLSSMAAGIAQLRYQVEAFMGPNAPIYLLWAPSFCSSSC